MKLHLKNFCCWEDRIFTFPDQGNVLISAPSGKGKTSIIRAIQFVLFGVGQKIVQHGKRKCSVEFWYKDLHVLRTKGPGRLVVNDVYEDKEAQYRIQQYFSEQMMCLAQDGKNNFVMMNPTNKLAYLEKIIFNKIDIVDIKTKIRNTIKERETTLLVKKTELNTTTEMLNEMTISEKITLPEHLIYSENCVQQKQDEYDTLGESYKNLQQNRTKNREYMKRKQELENLINTEQTILTQDEQELELCKSQLQELSDTKPLLLQKQNMLKYLSQTEEYTNAKKEFLSQQEIYDTTIKEERNVLESKIENLENDIKNTLSFSTTKDGKKQMNHFKSLISNHEEMKHLKQEKENIIIEHSVDDCSQEIANITKSIQLLQNQIHEIDEIYECPKCDTLLKIHDNKLTEETNFTLPEGGVPAIEKIIQEQYTNISNLEHQKSETIALLDRRNQITKKITNLYTGDDIDSIKSKLIQYEKDFEALLSHKAVLDEYYTQLDVIVKKYTRTKDHLTKLKRKCKQLKSNIITIPDSDKETIKENINIEELKQSINELQKSAGLFDHHEHTKCKLMKKIDTHTNSINKYNTELKHIISKLNVLTMVSNDDLDELDTRINQIRVDMDLLRKYQLYEKSYELFDKYNTKKITLESEIAECEKLLSAALRFREKIIEAETIALTNLIHTINTNVQLYLEDFFTDEPLYATITSVKQTKTSKKSQIGIDIQYKGNPFDLQSLSGGERDRLILAFALALSDLNNTPILLLDECVSSLDQVSADLVFHSIKGNCKDRLTILIAHQIVTGMFDEMIRL
jgi:DNA repair exonuclease SbcCD ATPase subunit